MKITEIRTMLDLIKKFTEETPLNVEQEPEISADELANFKAIQDELIKKKFVDTYKRLAYYKPEK
jgi:hypothetical protein